MGEALRRAARLGPFLSGVLALSACADAPVDASVEGISGGWPADITFRADGSVALDDLRQWVRDASVRVNPGCSGVLVSPRVVLTAAHCVRAVSALNVSFSPFLPDGTYGDSLAPANIPNPPTLGLVAACAIHPARGGSCFDGFVQVSPAENDLAVLVLSERFGPSFGARAWSRYPVVPAHVVERDPDTATGRLDWIGDSVWVAGYGQIGDFDDRLPIMRPIAITAVSAVIDRYFYMAPSRSWSGDSGCGVFIERTDDLRPLQVLGINESDDGTSARAVLLTEGGMQNFMDDYLGPADRHYPGAMVGVVTSTGAPTEVWTGPPDVPMIDEGGRAGWIDPASGLAASALDPDGDGLRGRHDNCWGVSNPRQDVEDAWVVASVMGSVFSSTGFAGGEAIDVIVDGSPTTRVTFTSGDQSPTQVARRINRALGYAAAIVSAGAIRLQGLVLGPSGSLTLTDATPGALAAIGHVGGVTAGTGLITSCTPRWSTIPIVYGCAPRPTLWMA